jgi:hypothetical protein
MSWIELRVGRGAMDRDDDAPADIPAASRPALRAVDRPNPTFWKE